MTDLEGWLTTAVEVFAEVKPLADRLPQDRFEVVIDDGYQHGEAAQRLLGCLARQVGLRQAIQICSAPQQPPSSFGLAVERRIRGLLRESESFEAWVEDAEKESIRRAVTRVREHSPQPVRIDTSDGLTLEVFTAGDRTRPAVMLIPPCGMPVELSRRWLRALGEGHFVMTWQTRGLFLGEPPAGMASEVAVQADDLLAVLDALDV